MTILTIIGKNEVNKVYYSACGCRGANGVIALLVPAKVIEEKCKKYMKRGKANHRNNLLQDDYFSIVQTY